MPYPPNFQWDSRSLRIHRIQLHFHSIQRASIQLSRPAKTFPASLLSFHLSCHIGSRSKMACQWKQTSLSLPSSSLVSSCPASLPGRFFVGVTRPLPFPVPICVSLLHLDCLPHHQVLLFGYRQAAMLMPFIDPLSCMALSLSMQCPNPTLQSF